jgi:uncharacterized protein
MRLTQNEVETIRRTARDVFPADVRVWLFGSRTQDEARGGDIDLLVETDTPLDNPVSLACRYTALLQQALGDQRIDVLVADPKSKRQVIHDIARQTGVRL